jgi:hypothetical protein
VTPEFEIREIDDADLPEVMTLLCEGFPNRTADYWQTGLQRMADLERLPAIEKYGYVLASGDGLHGVILTLPSRHEGVDGPKVIVNVSSWYVRPSFRGAPARELYRYASRREDVSYTNLSPAPHTIKTVTASGFREWTAGQMVAVSFRRSSSSRSDRVLTTAAAEEAGLSSTEAAVLGDHERLGCLTLCLETRNGLSPLAFVRRRFKGLLPCAQLIYCSDLVELVDNGRRVWAWLARQGFPLMLLDASAPVTGLTGRYIPGRGRKYIKGPLPSKAVDHAYSEMVLLGF